MTDEKTSAVSVTPSAKPSAVSVREKSTLDLTRAIRSPEDKTEINATILDRANTAINLGYVPDWSPEERARVLDEYRKALRNFPLWAIHNAFDTAARTMVRRASPGELVILAQRAIKPITYELARRRQEYDQQQEELAARTAARPSPEQAERILQSAGFTPKRMAAVRKHPTALSMDEAEAASDRPETRHWTEAAAPDSQAMKDLQKARDANPLIQAAREAQRKRESRGNAA